MRDVTRDHAGKGSRETVQMPKQLPRYHSYLLRCWEEDGVKSWRFMLENPHNGEKRGFESCAELMTFLEGELAEGATPAKECGT